MDYLKKYLDTLLFSVEYLSKKTLEYILAQQTSSNPSETILQEIDLYFITHGFNTPTHLEALSKTRKLLQEIYTPRQIIRIEYPQSGIGVWRAEDENGDYLLDKIENFYSFQSRHANFATLQADISNYFQKISYAVSFIVSRHYCAFKSVEQLQDWITPQELRDIMDLGFNVYLIEVQKAIECEYQIAYQKSDILSQQVINDLFK